MKLFLHKELYAVCRLDPGAAIPSWVSQSPIYFVAKTREELSLVCLQAGVPEATRRGVAAMRAELGWRLIHVEGPLDFGLTGILAGIANPLAQAGVSIFALSTFDTDYMLVKEESLAKAVKALEAAGHSFSG